ncbi:hypothetical protein [Actinospica robiniae]|uniref:hypothetical protein n=1 Tax=Actinospica robiniae TaxID=304901 RepID=UPI00041D1147|nr:hypothetical protein [Actinospica robiniae]
MAVAVAVPLVLAGCSGGTAASPAPSSTAPPPISASACAAIESAWKAFAPTMTAESPFPTADSLNAEIAALGLLQAEVGNYMSAKPVTDFMGDLSDLGDQLTTVENDLSGLGNVVGLPVADSDLYRAQLHATSDERAIAGDCAVV